MTKELEQLGLYDNGIFHRSGKEVEVKVLGLGMINNTDNPKGGNYVPPETDAYVIGSRYSPTSNIFPIIYLKKK